MRSNLENAKNRFYLTDAAAGRDLEFEPYLMLEARIDFNDVRTGYRQTCGIQKIVAIPEEMVEPLWDDDGIKDVNSDKLTTDPPENIRIRNLPKHLDETFISFIEIRFIEYLLRTFTVQIYRNYFLGVYSAYGESRSDFIIRCIELVQTPMYSEFDSMLEVFERKLERLQQKYLFQEELEDIKRMKVDSRNRELFHFIAERVLSLFLRTEFSIQSFTKPTSPEPYIQEFEDRLHTLHLEAKETVAKILDFYEEKAKSIDEYLLHPSMKNIHFVRSFLLWIPTGAAVDDR